MPRYLSVLLLEKIRLALFEWPIARRLALVCGLLAFETSLYLMVSLYMWFTSSSDFINPEVLGPTIIALIAGAVFFLAACFFTTKMLDPTKSYVLVQSVVLGVYGLMLVGGDWVIGKGTTFGGVNYLGGAVVGIILLNRWVVYSVVGLSQILLYFVLYLSYQGLMPLAPLRTGTMVQPNMYEWIVLSDVLSLTKVWVLILMIDLMVSTLRREQVKVKHLSERDPLTGLLNRLSLRERLVQSVAAKYHMCILLIDVDYFKRINDTYGHPVGDQVLVSLADTLQKALRPGDVCWRYGGEEFLVLLENLSHAEGIEVARRVRAQIRDTPINADGQIISVRVSVGLASMNRKSIANTSYSDGDLVRKLIKTADDMLYRSKTAGRDRVTAAVVDTQLEIDRVNIEA